MKVQTITRVNVGVSDPLVVNTNISPCNIGFGTVVNDTATYSVQHTFDDPAVGFTTWYSHPTVAGEDANADGNYAFPITAVRILITAATLDSSVTLNLVQAGI